MTKLILRFIISNNVARTGLAFYAKECGKLEIKLLTALGETSLTPSFLGLKGGTSENN